MMKQGSVDWYGDELLVALDGATDEIARRLAFHIEAEAKVGAPVDTGFHRNAIYTVTRRGAEGAPPPGGSYRSAKTGATVGREAAPTPPLPENVLAAVHAAAVYAIFAELHQPHLYPAAERVARRAGGEIKQVAARRGLT